MHRFIVSPKDIKDGLITINGDEHKHLSQVLRLDTGSIIKVFDGSGIEYEAELTSVNKTASVAKINLSYKSEAEPEIHITLYQGLPKGEKMDLIIQKAVELGVCKIVPVKTERSVVQLNSKDGLKKTERWSRIAKEAAKQCGRAYIPEIGHPVSFKEALEQRNEDQKTLLMYEANQKKCLKEQLKCYNINKIRDIVLFIGPEGGFSDQEIEYCISSGVDVAWLGNRILRTETAAIAVLSIIMYEMGELQ